MSSEVMKTNMLDEISNKLEKYIEVKDIILENEFSEALQDSFSILKLLKNANTLIAKKRFESFLKGFNSEELIPEAKLQKLRDYVDNTKKAEYIADMFSKVFLSNSKIACTIMGIIAHNLIENKLDISHKDLICAEAITKFFDDDIRNYKLIFEYIEVYMNKHKGMKRRGFEMDRYFTAFCKEKNIDKDSVMLTLEKAVSNQLLTRESDVDLNIDESSVDSSSVDYYELYFQTAPGEQLFNYIQKLNSLFGNDVG